MVNGKATTILDKLDKAILYELDLDGFQPFSLIGKKLGKGRDVIQYRVKRLEEEGIIRNYISIIDYGKLGYLMGALYIKYRHENSRLKRELSEYFASKDNVWWICAMEGEYDLAFGWYASSINSLKESMRELVGAYKRNVEAYRFRFFNKFYQYPKDYLHSGPVIRERRRIEIDADSNRIVDALDEKILLILAEHARKPVIEIAGELKLPPHIVHGRIRSLKERKVILGARPAIDLSKIGYEWYKLDICLDDYSAYREVLNFVSRIPNVVYAFDVFGGADIELDIQVRNYSEFKEIEDSILDKFSGSIEKTDFIIFPREIKQTYLPPFQRIPSRR